MPFAYAAAAPQQGADPMAGLLSTLLFFGAILLIFYLMILRPQIKRQKEHQKMLSELKKGRPRRHHCGHPRYGDRYRGQRRRAPNC
jgi:hypothetical protein